MSKLLKVLCSFACVFAFCFLSIGYAAVQDTLSVTGSVSIKAQTKPADISYEDVTAYTLDNIGTLEILENFIADEKSFYVKTIKTKGFHSDNYESAGDVELVKLPKTLIGIGEGAFTGFPNLKTFSVADGNPAFKVENDVLFSIDGTGLVRYAPNRTVGDTGMYKIPAGVTQVASAAFADIPDGTAVVTKLQASAWGATSRSLILQASDHYDAIQSVSGDSTNGYTFTCDSAVGNPNLVYRIAGGARKWEAVENNQFTVPAALCSATPAVVTVSTVIGDINQAQLTADLADDHKAVIGGGEWPTWELSADRADELIINDGIFNGIMRIDHSNVVINGGDFKGSFIWCEGTNFVINNGKFSASSMTFYNERSPVSVEIIDGDFSWTGIGFNTAYIASLIIKGGTFGFDPSGYIAEGCTVVDLGGGKWKVERGPNAAAVNEEEVPVCSCETKCAEPNEACAVCKADIASCEGAEAPAEETPVCTCETRCTEPNEACAVCSADISGCNGKVSEPEADDADKETVTPETTEVPGEQPSVPTPAPPKDDAPVVSTTEEALPPEPSETKETEEASATE